MLSNVNQPVFPEDFQL